MIQVATLQQQSRPSARMTHAARWGVKEPPARGPKPAQRSFDEVVTWGGRRKGAGRKAGPRRVVPHERRPAHARWVPSHVTLRRAKGLPSLRAELLHAVIKRVVRATAKDGFRIAHYSVQHDHVHLIIEAEDAAALSHGMRSFAIRAARTLNRDGLRGRRGRIWGDRYHRHDLPTPTEVRNALVYVLANGVKHGVVPRGTVDPCSSAAWFDGWIDPRPPPLEPPPTEAAQTWLLRTGWSTVHPGFLFRSEVPKAARPAASARAEP
jgi:putative transposase